MKKLLLLKLFFLCTLPCFSLLAQPQLHTGWPQTFNQNGSAWMTNILAVVRDQTGDSYIAASTRGLTGVFTINGDLLEGWPVSNTEFSNIAGPRIGTTGEDRNLVIGMMALDLPEKEFSLFSWRGESLEEAFHQHEVTSNYISSFVFLDLDDDGNDEIIYQVDSLYIWRCDGSNYPGYPMDLGGNNYWMGVPVIGKDIQGYDDFIVWLTNGQLHAKSINAIQELPGWPVPISGFQAEQGTPPVLIPTPDGWVVAAGNADSIYVFDQDANLQPGFPLHPDVSAPGRQLYTLSVGDVDGDTSPDLVFHMTDSLLHVINLSGQYVEGFPVSVSNNGAGEEVVIVRDQEQEAMIFLSSVREPREDDILLLVGLRGNQPLPGFPARLPDTELRLGASTALFPGNEDTLQIAQNSNSGVIAVWDYPTNSTEWTFEWAQSANCAGGNRLYQPFYYTRAGERAYQQRMGTEQSIQVHPNPSNGSVFVGFDHIRSVSKVSITDILGREVWQMNVNELVNSGSSLIWSAMTDEDIPVPTGTYVISVIGATVTSEKVLIIR